MGSHRFALLRRCAWKSRRALLLLGPCVVAGPLLVENCAATENRSAGQAAPVYYCRLSVLDGGTARDTALAPVDVSRPAGASNPFAAERPELAPAHWVFAAGESKPAAATGAAALPVVGDFNGDGRSDIGVYLDGEWFLDLNGNGRWDADDLWAKLGGPGDQPLVGDWDGDGKADIGVFGVGVLPAGAGQAVESGLPDADNHNSHNGSERSLPGRPVLLFQRGAKGELQTRPVDHVLIFDDRPGIAVAGDFNGDGIDTIGIFRHGVWSLDVDGDGRASLTDRELSFGTADDWPIVGDFDGDGVDEIGIYQQGKWLIHTTTGQRQITAPSLGDERSAPIVGDFDGDGRDEAAIFVNG